MNRWRLLNAERGYADSTTTDGGTPMIVLGIIVAVLGLLLNVPVLWTIGLVLLVIGIALWIAGAMGHEIAGRRHYW